MSSVLNKAFKNLRCVGHLDNGQPVFSGEDIFMLMDSHGVPLELTVDALRGKAAFDLRSFVRAAKASGNYSNDKIKLIIDTQDRLSDVCAKIERKSL